MLTTTTTANQFLLVNRNVSLMMCDVRVSCAAPDRQTNARTSHDDNDTGDIYGLRQCDVGNNNIFKHFSIGFYYYVFTILHTMMGFPSILDDNPLSLSFFLSFPFMWLISPHTLDRHWQWEYFAEIKTRFNAAFYSVVPLGTKSSLFYRLYKWLGLGIQAQGLVLPNHILVLEKKLHLL